MPPRSRLGRIWSRGITCPVPAAGWRTRGLLVQRDRRDQDETNSTSSTRSCMERRNGCVYSRTKTSTISVAPNIRGILLPRRSLRMPSSTNFRTALLAAWNDLPVLSATLGIVMYGETINDSATSRTIPLALASLNRVRNDFCTSKSCSTRLAVSTAEASRPLAKNPIHPSQSPSPLTAARRSSYSVL